MVECERHSQVMLWEDGCGSGMKGEKNLGDGAVGSLCYCPGDGRCRQKQQSTEGWRREE